MHGLLVGHGRKFAQIHAQLLLEYLFDHALENGANFFLVQERGFAVDLRELRLAISAQVFVTEALGDLVVAVVARHHQHLLVELGRLGQREELAIVHTAGHQVVARAFGRALAQHGRFDIDETFLVQEVAHLNSRFVAQHQVALHGRTAQVHHAVRQACGFRQVVVIHLEGRRDRGIEHHQLVAQHFDLAALELVVGRASRARTHQAFDLHAKLVAHVFGHFEHLWAIGIAHHLHITFAVAQVDEDHATMVAAAVDPATQSNGLPHQGFGHETAVFRAHGHG